MKPIADAFQALLAAFDRLEMRYAVGGSVASSEYGNYRLTNSVDIVVALREDEVDVLLSALGRDFYADGETLREAIRLGRSANIIHMPTAYKFVLFPAGERPFVHRELERRQYREAAFAGERIEFAMVSAEDAILAKLDRMRQSSGGSEQQQRDTLGMLAVQKDRLDRPYLEASAAELGVADELSTLLGEQQSRGDGNGSTYVSWDGDWRDGGFRTAGEAAEHSLRLRGSTARAFDGLLRQPGSEDSEPGPARRRRHPV